jgi:hypothetical protein
LVGKSYTPIGLSLGLLDDLEIVSIPDMHIGGYWHLVEYLGAIKLPLLLGLGFGVLVVGS